jgi:hypothetical protein
MQVSVGQRKKHLNLVDPQIIDRGEVPEALRILLAH